MRGKRPINADAPAGSVPPKATEPSEAGEQAAPTQVATPATATAKKAEPAKTTPPPSKPPTSRRGKVPTALKAIAGLVLVALVFLIAAVLGGGGSQKESSGSAPAPSPSGNPPEEKETAAAAAAEELGYPSFATNNTTRIGGADPATSAAAVSLAVYPSTGPGQRPAAVALVDEDEWRAAIAAAVLMSAPIKAPLLVTSGGKLPDATEQALEALAPQGSKATEGAQAFAIGSAPEPQGLKTVKVKGSPAALAVALVALRDKLAGGPPSGIVLISEESPEFAMPAAAWAARAGNPVLFTGRDKLPGATASALGEIREVPIYVLGPTSAISSNVVREVAKIGNKVRRVSGESPVENAIAFARYAKGGFGWNVNDPGHGFVLARSDDPLIGAISAPLSASGTWGPLLLTDDADTLPKALREYFLDIKPGYTTDPTRAFYNHVWVIGDQEAIDVRQQAEVNQLAELAKIGGGAQ